MTIQTGDRIPEVVLKRIRNGVESVDTPTLFEGRKVLLFAVPGAFTPTCSEKHLPGFIARFEDSYTRELEVFLRVVSGTGSVPATIDDAVASLRIARACALSRREHRPIRVSEIIASTEEAKA